MKTTIIIGMCILILISGCKSESEKKLEICKNQGYETYFADIAESEGVCCRYEHCGISLCVPFITAKETKFNENDYPCQPVKNITCYNDTIKKYNGELNDSCYFDGCKTECEDYELKQYASIFGGIDRTAVYDYTDCLIECLDDIDIKQGDTMWKAHDYSCIINETIQEINETRCY